RSPTAPREVAAFGSLFVLLRWRSGDLIWAQVPEPHRPAKVEHPLHAGLDRQVSQSADGLITARQHTGDPERRLGARTVNLLVFLALVESRFNLDHLCQSCQSGDKTDYLVEFEVETADVHATTVEPRGDPGRLETDR